MYLVLVRIEGQRWEISGHLSPLVLSKWEDLAFSVYTLFEESVFIFQFVNNKMHNYVLFNTFVHFIIQKLKNKHSFLKTEKAKFSQRENLVFILFEKIVFFFQIFNDKIHNYVLFAIIVRFNIQKLKNKHTFLKTEKAKFSHRENLVFILFEEIVFFFSIF